MPTSLTDRDSIFPLRDKERGLVARRWSRPRGDGTPSFDSSHGILPVTGLTARNCSLVWFSHGNQPLPTSAIPAIAFAPRMHKQPALPIRNAANSRTLTRLQSFRHVFLKRVRTVSDPGKTRLNCNAYCCAESRGENSSRIYWSFLDTAAHPGGRQGTVASPKHGVL